MRGRHGRSGTARSQLPKPPDSGIIALEGAVATAAGYGARAASMVVFDIAQQRPPTMPRRQRLPDPMLMVKESGVGTDLGRGQGQGAIFRS